MKAPIAKVSNGNFTINAVALTERLSLLGKNIVAANATPDAGAQTTLELLKNPVLLKMAKNDSVLASQIASIKKQTTSELKDAQTKQAQCQTAIATMLQSAMNLLKP